MGNNFIPPIDAGNLIDSVIPGTFGAAIPAQFMPEAKNYAEDPAVVARIEEELYGLIQQTRIDRTNMNDEWQAIRRMEQLEHDDGKKYNGRSDVYLPVFNNTSKTLVTNFSSALFPSDEYMDVTDRGGQKLEEAKAIKTYLQWEFETVAQLRRTAKPFLKQLVNYGNSPLKYRYHKQQRYEGRLKAGDFGKPMASFRPQTTVDGLSVSARSVFNVYVYPTTAESLNECTLLFEDIDVPRSWTDERFRLKEWLNQDLASTNYVPPEHLREQIEIHEAMASITSPASTSHRDSPQGDIRCVTEVWTYMRLPASAYMPDEDKNCQLPVMIVMFGNTPVRVTRNPYWHQNPPYLWARTNVHPGFFYGYGTGRVMRALQYLSNDSANQMNDCGIYALNPFAKVNPALLAGPMPKLRPGATIPVSDEKAVIFDRPPADLIQYGAQLMQMWMGMSQDFSGAPPLLQGTGGGKNAKTATGAQILQHNAKLPLQDIVEDIELDVLIPLMRGTWINAQQFRDEAIEVAVAGRSLKIDPSSLAIDADFRWLASSQAINSQVRAQQAIGLLQSIMPLMPLLQMQQYVVDPAPLLRRIYSDGFGFRGFDEFIHKITPPEMMQQQQAQMAAQGGMPPEGPGGPGGSPPQESPMRSAVEQVGGELPAAPGEAEEFMNVRRMAEEQSGAMGGNGGEQF